MRFTVFISWFAVLLLQATTSRWSAAAEPVPAPDFSRYLEGEYLFERNCVACHGVVGMVMESWHRPDTSATIVPRRHVQVSHHASGQAADRG